METSVAHLADRIFPAVPVRQFVFALSIDLRLLLIPGDCGCCSYPEMYWQ